MTNEHDRLLAAAVEHVPFEGMNEAALFAGAVDIGMERALVKVHFPHGGADLAAAYHRRADAKLREWLENTPPEGRFRDRIEQAVWHRLILVEPDLVRAGAAIMSLPQNSVLGARLLWESANVIWTGLGDISEDSNWYTKRATLSAVIGATALFWLGDESEEQHETRAFLDRRIEGVMRFEKAKAGFRKIPGAAGLADLATGWIKAPRDRNLPGGINER